MLDLKAYLFLFIVAIWMGYWRFIHNKIPFDDKKLGTNEKLLKLEWERLNQHVYHVQIIGFSFIIAGLTIIEKSFGIPLIIFGIAILFLALSTDGRAERRYHWLHKIIEKKK